MVQVLVLFILQRDIASITDRPARLRSCGPTQFVSACYKNELIYDFDLVTITMALASGIHKSGSLTTDIPIGTRDTATQSEHSRA